MKKQILIGLIAVSSILTINAQWNNIPNSGQMYTDLSIGIGTSFISPLNKLEVRNDVMNGWSRLSFSNYTVSRQVFLGTFGHNAGVFVHDYDLKNWMPLYLNTIDGNSGIVVNGTSNGNVGNVGIGTPTPDITNMLEVNKDGINGWHRLSFSNRTADRQVFLGTFGANAGVFAHNFALNTWMPLYLNTVTGNSGMVILGDGSVGIGTANPTYTLDVNGTIRANEVKVCLPGGCDFVFKSDYKLMDLNALEKFIKTNQHLPEIAPEKEMVENGVNMKELQMKLLQKIEELTLYTIEQNKKIEKQNEKILDMENEMKEIRKK
jgi:hypothetical protein